MLSFEVDTAVHRILQYMDCFSIPSNLCGRKKKENTYMRMKYGDMREKPPEDYSSKPKLR